MKVRMDFYANVRVSRFFEEVFHHSSDAFMYELSNDNYHLNDPLNPSFLSPQTSLH